jgi:hypothetical protein
VYRRRGRPKRTWRRTIEDEIRNTGRSWNEVKGIDRNKITNEDLWRITKQKPIEIQIKRRK